MASVVRGVLSTIKEKGIGGFFKHLRDEGYTQTKIHNIGATLVGVDKFGNKYYEKLDVQYGRHRWVEYAEKGRYNASQVPPEWHGWLHYITDHTGDELLMLKPKSYGVEHRENFSGEGDEYIYHSKGHALNPGQRDWTCMPGVADHSYLNLKSSVRYSVKQHSSDRLLIVTNMLASLHVPSPTHPSKPIPGETRFRRTGPTWQRVGRLPNSTQAESNGRSWEMMEKCGLLSLLLFDDRKVQRLITENRGIDVVDSNSDLPGDRLECHDQIRGVITLFTRDLLQQHSGTTPSAATYGKHVHGRGSPDPRCRVVHGSKPRLLFSNNFQSFQCRAFQCLVQAHFVERLLIDDAKRCDFAARESQMTAPEEILTSAACPRDVISRPEEIVTSETRPREPSRRRDSFGRRGFGSFDGTSGNFAQES
ncbi:NADH dehydrogenase (ubiquinone) 1 alpha subcomplex, partial [Musa troglodytarum]